MASLLERFLADLLRKESHTFLPRGFLTVTWVKVSPDLSQAKVYVSLYEVENKAAVMDAITQRRRAIRKALGNAFRHSMRKIPEISFVLDETDMRGEQIDDLIQER